MNQKKCIVLFSGGLDSSICLHMAIESYGAENIVAVSFDYHQSHRIELEAAKKITKELNVDHKIFNIDVMKQITNCALTDGHEDLNSRNQKGRLNIVLPGRNGLFLRMAAMYGTTVGADKLMTGINETDNPEFPDCSRQYMDALQSVFRIDFENQDYEVITPLVHLVKKEIFELAYTKGLLEDLLQKTITCYKGKPGKGCGICPSCTVKNEGLKQLQQDYPELKIPYTL